MPKPDELKSQGNVRYRYYCDNETVQGVEFNYVPVDGEVPLVCDMTSNFLLRSVDVEKYGSIFASAQKNCGMAGLCIAIVRNDLIGNQRHYTPTIQNYKVMADSKSLYNTPPTFAIYVAELCFKWMIDQGGLAALDEMSKLKAKELYDTIDSSNGFYTCRVAEKGRSRMNVVFKLPNNERSGIARAKRTQVCRWL